MARGHERGNHPLSNQPHGSAVTLSQTFSLGCLVLILTQNLAVGATPECADNARVKRITSSLVVKDNSQSTSLERRMREYAVPGVSIAIINASRIEWTCAYGVTSAGGNQPVTADTVFQAASISKPVTALAVLRLADQGSLELDRDVNYYLRSWQLPSDNITAGGPVTLRRLLNHSAGLSVSGFDGYRNEQAVPTVLQILNGEPPANSAPIRRIAEAGKTWDYSGGGYVLIQALLEDQVTKFKSQKYEDFPHLMKALVLKPAGMSQSYFEQPLSRPHESHAASGHDNKGQIINGRWMTHPELAAADLWTTPRDLALFAIKLQDALSGKPGSMITQSMAQQMLTPILGNFGLGIGIKNTDGHIEFGHLGGNIGYRSFLLASTENGTGAVIMTNGDNGLELINEIIPAIVAEYGWAAESKKPH
jgi:CubicO group peptidase (beta-lactamase class C family)